MARRTAWRLRIRQSEAQRPRSTAWGEGASQPPGLRRLTHATTNFCHICEHLGSNHIHNAPKRCYLSSESHSSGLEHSELTLKVVSPISEHGTTWKMQKKWKTTKNRVFMVFHGFPCFSWFSHAFGEKCSKFAGKVVAAGVRDQKSIVRAHLVAEKLSVTSYFCPQTCSEPEWTPIFPG